MAEKTENGKKPDDAQIRKELLNRSAALKKKVALLKEQMDSTAKSCKEFLNKEKGNGSSR